MNKIALILSFILILSGACLFAEEKQDSSSESSFERFLKRLLEKSEFVKNRVTIELNYGLSGLSFPGNMLEDELAKAYNAEFVYGFSRCNDRLKIDDIFHFSSEFLFLRDISSHFKPRSIEKKGITTDTWQFGFGICNGYGYNFFGSKFILYHAGAFVWTHVDVELPASNPGDRRLLDRYDEQFRFGSYWNGGIKYQIAGPLLLDIGYEHTIVFQRTLFGKYFCSWLIENISQRWIDFFEDDFMDVHQRNWPWVNWLVKNALSFALYELRRHNMNWPFKTNAPLSFDSFKLGVTLVF